MHIFHAGVANKEHVRFKEKVSGPDIFFVFENLFFLFSRSNLF